MSPSRTTSLDPQQPVEDQLAHDPERLVRLSRGELERGELLRTLEHLTECAECAGKFKVIVMLYAAVLENLSR